ncbi:hypothetical protein TK0412 [Thermococcus kodakarensis KOD1]|uniref:Uncharacterized protein n=1 Tax=Thermococcus kodakarensis (strain ATCC BAA-918 / JCM 12380 / KOD1) TaxID=69014 RepID=Q5JD17_THEKO|nr:hypothetical protein [Thermococcus kodakarensis]WCN28485.1 hypothetical protein POG15_02115 [Thermococcus kodakarensis]WCN30781.1 hypothetical protein POG21_02115 [Thermococcus kodakarensis]BAD84601.1 hypothetical protein TK0412 [Thermococcus kodakarensis KOD1]
MREYSFVFVKIDGEWIDEDDAIEEYGMSYVDMVEDSFELKVEAENWKDAEEKIRIAAEALRR